MFISQDSGVLPYTASENFEFFIEHLTWREQIPKPFYCDSTSAKYFISRQPKKKRSSLLKGSNKMKVSSSSYYSKKPHNE